MLELESKRETERYGALVCSTHINPQMSHHSLFFSLSHSFSFDKHFVIVLQYMSH